MTTSGTVAVCRLPDAGTVMNASISVPSKLLNVNDSTSATVFVASSAAFSVVTCLPAPSPSLMYSSAGAAAVEKVYAIAFLPTDQEPSDPFAAMIGSAGNPEGLLPRDVSCGGNSLGLPEGTASFISFVEPRSCTEKKIALPSGAH